jgi:hypothetical protein
MPQQRTARRPLPQEHRAEVEVLIGCAAVVAQP